MTSERRRRRINGQGKANCSLALVHIRAAQLQSGGESNCEMNWKESVVGVGVIEEESHRPSASMNLTKMMMIITVVIKTQL